MKNADWTLLFLVPSSYGAVNTVRLVNSTVVMVLVFMGILVLISSFFIFYTVRLQHKEVLDAESSQEAIYSMMIWGITGKA